MKIKSIVIAALLILVCSYANSANYTLEIIQPQPSLSTKNRYYKAYPGLEYKVPIGVIGGVLPFTYSLTGNTTCPDVSIDSDTGVITWSSPSTDDTGCTIEAQVADSESSTDTVSWTVTVSTSGFIFVDSAAGDGGDGSVSSPFNSMVDVYGGTTYSDMTETDFDDYAVYWKAGTYQLEGYIDSGKLAWRPAYKPVIWLAYPGDSPVIDMGDPAASINMSDGGTDSDLFFQGIRFEDYSGSTHMFRMVGARHVWFECTFANWGPGVDGQNSAAIMWYGDQVNKDLSTYNYLKDNTFTGMNPGTGNCVLKLYSGTKFLIERNTVGALGGAGTHEGIAVKADMDRCEISHNSFNGPTEHVINGNMNRCTDTEIRYNLVLNAATTAYGALTLNYQEENVGETHVERNTFDGAVSVRGAGTGDGPFYLSNNVIVNESGDADGIDCGLDSPCTDETVIILGNGADANLVGDAADGIIDANGDLQGAYTSYLGTKGYQTVTISASPPVISGCVFK